MAYSLDTAVRFTAVFTDEQRQVARTGFWMKLSALQAGEYPFGPVVAGPMLGALQDNSGAGLTDQTLTLSQHDPTLRPIAATGDYSDVEDKAVYVWACELGHVVTIELPSPYEQVFNDTFEVVDDTSAGFAELFLAAVNTSVCCKYGHSLVKYVRGWRIRKKTRRGVVGSPI